MRRITVCAPVVTIADLGDFAAEKYPAALDAWCRATLQSWGAELAGTTGFVHPR